MNFITDNFVKNFFNNSTKTDEDLDKFINKKFTYYVHGQRTVYDYGYIVFDYDGTRRVWKILDDGAESLVIRTSGSYDYGSNSGGETTTMFLTRVGP